MKFDFRKTFVILSIFFLSGMVLFYGYRLIYFYQKENANKERVYTMIEYLTREEYLLKNKLLKKENRYYFDKTASNNYLYFSGILYRILYFDEEKIYVVADDCVTYLKYGIAETYDTSSIHEWLNTVYLPNLNQQYLATKEVNLLTKEMFSEMGASESFLVGEDFWLLDDNQGLIVTREGELSKPTNYEVFIGIKPTIVLNGKTNYIRGRGVKTDPYVIEDKEAKQLSNVSVGEYLTYQDKTFRVVEKNDAGVRVVAVQKLDQTYAFSDSSNQYATSGSSLGNYLNHEYLDTLKKEDLVETTWKTGEYHFDYKEVSEDTVSAYVGLLTVGDYFITDNVDGFLLTKSGNNIYAMNDDKFLYEEKPSSPLNVYPSFTLKGDLAIQRGMGYRDNPYVVGE